LRPQNLCDAVWSRCRGGGCQRKEGYAAVSWAANCGDSPPLRATKVAAYTAVCKRLGRYKAHGRVTLENGVVWHFSITLTRFVVEQ